MDNEENKTPQDMLQLNRPRSIVPPMQNVVGNTYAETRAEMEAKQRADLEAELALARAREEAAEKPKKSVLWLGILSIIFLVIALGATAFAIFMYDQNIKLQDEYTSLDQDYNSALRRVSELEDAYAKTQERLNAFLNKEKSEETPAETSAEE